MKTSRTPLLILLAAPFLAANIASGQTQPAATAAGNDLTTLPEFTVTASPQSEYMATESVTGTRVAVKIRDLPFTVNVVTGEFLDDFAALEFREQFGYTSSVSVWETLSTGYSVRGFDADVQLRNGFRRIGLIDKINVDRAEVIKGPAASIYGTVLPGGTINVITKKPQLKPEQRFGLYYGSNALQRVRFSSTGPIDANAKWLYRIDAADDSNEYDQLFKKKKQRTVAAQLMWRPDSHTSLNIEYEWLKRDEISISSTSIPIEVATVSDPYRTGRTYSSWIGIRKDLIDFNPQGPKNYSNRYVHNVTASFEHRINDRLSLRSSANWFERGLERQEIGSRSRYFAATNTTDRGTPRLRPFGEGGASWQTDLLASWETGSIKHKTLFTVDYQRQTEAPERWDMTSAGIASGGMPAEVLSGLKIDQPNYDFVSYYENPSLYTLAQKEKNSLDIYGVFLSERLTFLQDRANVMLGIRYDYVDNQAHDLRAQETSERQVDEITYQLGANYRLLPSLTAFSNVTKSFVPQFGVGRNADGSTYELPNELGHGWEVGLKADLFDGRMTFTTTYFDIERENVARDTYDADTNAAITVLSGKEASKGIEFDFNWVVTPELQVFGGYGYVDAKYVSHAQAPFLEGVPLRRSPKDNLGVGLKYSAKSGPLKGMYCTAGFKHYGRSLVNPSTGRLLTASSGTPIINTPMPNGQLPFPNQPEGTLVTSGSVRVDDGRESIFNDAYSITEVGIGYGWKQGKYHHKLQLNVTNLFDEVYTYGSAGPGAGLGWVTSYDLRF